MEQMEKLFDELSDENGEYQLSLRWETKHILSEVHGGIIEIINPEKDCFEYDGYRVWWYHAGNLKHPDTPVVVISWQSNVREDSWDENEEEVDATAEDIASFISTVTREGGELPDRSLPDRLEEIG
jgi:hypothetical protein